MNDIELMELFKEAEAQSFIYNILDPAACTSDCDNCPAAEACSQLSNDGTAGPSYSLFVSNYKNLLERIEDAKY